MSLFRTKNIRIISTNLFVQWYVSLPVLQANIKIQWFQARTKFDVLRNFSEYW